MAVYIFVLFCGIACSFRAAGAKTVWDLVYDSNRLREVATLIETHSLASYFEEDNITAFIPTSEAFLSLNSKIFDYHLESNEQQAKGFVLYHIARGRIRQHEMFDNSSIVTKHPLNLKLFFNVFPQETGNIYTVNGAILTTANIEASNGVLHIIDRVLAPVGSVRPLFHYMLHPEVNFLSFKSITRSSIIDMNLKEETNTTNKFFTAFAPNDSFIFPMPDYGQEVLFNDGDLLRTVIRSHMVSDRVVFLPGQGDIEDINALAGTIHFTRNNGQLYVSNNHVRAKVVLPNIPVKNGVVHVIDDLLYYIYMNIIQKIKYMSTTKMFGSFLDNIPEAERTKLEGTQQRYTVFVPTNGAFAKIPLPIQRKLQEDTKLLREVIGGHIVTGMEYSLSALEDGSILRTIDNNTLHILHVGKDVYVKGGQMRAKIETANIGCTNGLVHLISNVLFLQNFTLWEAIQGSSQLSQMAGFITQYSDLQEVLHVGNSGPITVFLTSDSALQQVPIQTMEEIQDDPDLLLNAVRGQIAPYKSLSTGEISGKQEVISMGGQKLIISNRESGIRVEGSHIQASVIVEDIWCSNGVLHIVDNLLHIPTRNIIEELARWIDLSVMSMIVQALVEETALLTDSSQTFTFFVPSNEAFSTLPRDKAERLRTDVDFLGKVIRAHIVQGVTKYTEEYQDRETFTAEVGVIHILKGEDTYVVNNNVRGKINYGNIRATNGIIHVIDNLLYYPYFTIAETMETDPDLREFYDMMKSFPEFMEWSTSDDHQMTIFAPTKDFLASIPPEKLQSIKSNPDTLKGLFTGHVLPGARLDEEFLRQVFIDKYSVKGRYGVEFILNRGETGTTVDIGFDNMQLPVDLVGGGMACNNGVIYPIDGFLSLSLNDLLHEIQQQPLLKVAIGQLMKMLPDDLPRELESDKYQFTFLAPSNDAFSHLSYQDINYMNSNITESEQLQISWRHIINGSMVSYHELMKGQVSDHMKKEGVQILEKTD
ncbi:hypothetical protein ScPMuIL_003236, partial [Solemya velum]